MLCVICADSLHGQAIELQVQAPRVWRIDEDAKFFEVRLRNDRPVRALQFTLTYDSTVIAGIANTGEHRTTGVFEQRLHATGGRLTLLQVDFKGRPLNAGTGSIAAFQFRSGKSGWVQVGLVDAVVVGPSGEALPVRLTSGMVRVVADPTRLVSLIPSNLIRNPGSAQPIQVEVRDGFNNLVPGVVVQFRVATGGGRLSATRDTTDDQGRVAVQLTLDTLPGINSVIAQVPGFPNLSQTVSVVGSEAQDDNPAEGILSLKRGYNLIGLPVRPQAPLTAKGFLGLLSQIVSLTRYQNATNTFEDVFRAGTRVLGADYPLEVGGGYFVQLSAAVDYTLAGQSLDTPATLPLKRGFNLIALPYQGLNLTAFALLRSTPQAVALSRFDAGTQGFDNALRAGTRIIGSDFPLRVGEGYFVQVTADAGLFGSSAKMVAQEEQDLQTVPAFRVAEPQVISSNAIPQPVLSGPPGRLHLVYGRVEYEGGQPAVQVPVGLIIEGSQGISLPLQVRTDAEGWWIANLAEMRAPAGHAFAWKTGDRLVLLAGKTRHQAGQISPEGPQLLVPAQTSHASAEGPVLLQVYPNPFNSETAIEFRLPGAAKQPFALAIFNLSGQRVKTLAVFAGKNRIVWDGTDQAGRAVGSGMYFVRLDAEDHRVVRKVLLLR